MNERAKQLAEKLDNVTSETTEVWNEKSTIKVYNGFSEFEFSWREADWIYDLYNSGRIDGQDTLTKEFKKFHDVSYIERSHNV